MKMESLTIQAIGLMSGTSLDGLDICCATFQKSNDQWAFKIDCSKAYSYSDELKEKLGNKAQQMSAIEFVTFHSEYGKFLGKRVNDFMKEFHVKPDIIAGKLVWNLIKTGKLLVRVISINLF